MQTLEQKRAVTAYACVENIKTNLEDYKIAVNTFGTTILRSGLSAAFCLVERKKSQNSMYEKLVAHLCESGFAIGKLNGHGVDILKIPELIRKLELQDYILTTRQILRAVFWLKRATQAYRVDKK